MKTQKINLQALSDYLFNEEIDSSFALVSEEQANAIRAFGVPDMEDRLPIGQDYVYAGCLTFQWSPIGPLLVQL